METPTKKYSLILIFLGIIFEICLGIILISTQKIFNDYIFEIKTIESLILNRVIMNLIYYFIQFYEIYILEEEKIISIEVIKYIIIINIIMYLIPLILIFIGLVENKISTDFTGINMISIATINILALIGKSFFQYNNSININVIQNKIEYIQINALNNV